MPNHLSLQQLPKATQFHGLTYCNPFNYGQDVSLSGHWFWNVQNHQNDPPTKLVFFTYLIKIIANLHSCPAILGGVQPSDANFFAFIQT